MVQFYLLLCLPLSLTHLLVVCNPLSLFTLANRLQYHHARGVRGQLTPTKRHYATTRLAHCRDYITKWLPLPRPWIARAPPSRSSSLSFSSLFLFSPPSLSVSFYVSYTTRLTLSLPSTAGAARDALCALTVLAVAVTLRVTLLSHISPVNTHTLCPAEFWHTQSTLSTIITRALHRRVVEYILVRTISMDYADSNQIYQGFSYTFHRTHNFLEQHDIIATIPERNDRFKKLGAI